MIVVVNKFIYLITEKVITIVDDWKKKNSNLNIDIKYTDNLHSSIVISSVNPECSLEEILNPFTSNRIKYSGQIITPLVEGIRIKGNFLTTLSDNTISYALVDEIGLGHNSAYNQDVIEDFETSDYILFVKDNNVVIGDNEKKTIKEIVNNKWTTKVILAITHFDATVNDPSLILEKNF
ncbi:hypothetical protein AN396_02400 [Candidatus Epulonipiscium fishelsonii]|uniref:Uncharacterized protein n=1 Tax=Candidatus Epulonipiscium fishelsonii TaxID=77094 RepID=A0ACC8XFR2_9FIRM|nr:hypothetical protein AN396_02400 [Epulopiscium sp. SCG-B11WGA-EpuloA1]